MAQAEIKSLEIDTPFLSILIDLILERGFSKIIAPSCFTTILSPVMPKNDPYSLIVRWRIYKNLSYIELL